METTAILAFFAAVFAFAIAVTALSVSRRSLPQWAFGLGMIALAAESGFNGLAADALNPVHVVAWQRWGLLSMSLVPGLWLLFGFTYARGDCQAFLRKWSLALALAGIGPVLLVALGWSKLFVAAASAGIGQPWSLKLGTPGVALQILFLLGALTLLMNLERTFRASVGTMRWRIKYLILAMAVLFAARAYTCTQVLLFRSLDLSVQAVNSGALILGCALVVRGLLRAGNFEVQVYPSHSVLHGSLTILVVGIYLCVVGLGARLVVLLGGASAFELRAFLVLVSLIALAILLLSDRFRFFTRRFVSRHFQRPMYDYAAIWRRFAEGTARCVEQKDAAAAVLRLASDIFQALSVSLWLLDDKRALVCAGSTATVNFAPGELRLSAEDSAQVCQALKNRRDPIDLENCDESWALALKRQHPDFFGKGGHRVCTPLAAGGELLGLLLLGDRVSGFPFAAQEFELLKAISDQSAATLLNIQLSQRLSQAKQLEAFQAMSAFFVHDLKNTTSILSLMLQNLPVHYDDPEFREDALRGISKTVTHLNDLIGRLTLLRHELTIKPEPSDLNQLIGEVLEHQPQVSGIEIVKALQPLPKISLDPGQIQKVLTNLLLNARDALGPGGKITIQTGRHNGSAVLTVADTGCGMTSQFIANSLFRPFQTTKNKGLGIGMFHCKMIVEAHRGRIEVQSEAGKGTQFQVFLPITSV